MYSGDIQRAAELLWRSVEECQEGYTRYEPLKVALLLGREDQVQRLIKEEGLVVGDTFLAVLEEYGRQGYYAADGPVRKGIKLGGREAGRQALASLAPDAHREFLKLMLALTEVPGSAAKESFEGEYARFRSQFAESAPALADLLFWFSVDHYSRE